MCTFAAERGKHPLFAAYNMVADYYLIKLERFNQGLSQQDLAKKANLGLSTVIHAECGRSISPKSNRAIRDALGLK